MKRIASLFVVAFTLCARLVAQGGAIPEAEVLAVPTAMRFAAIHAAAQRDGWAPQSAALQVAGVRAYEREKPAAAEAWLNAFRWATLLGQSEPEFVPRWVQTVQAARLAHPNMPTRYDARPRLLAANLSPALQAWLVGNVAVSAEFFALLTPVDFAPRVLEILDELFKADPARFKTYVNLALAIAVVYDVPPPPDWPHAQVTNRALPRTLPPPAAAFAWWIKQEQRGRTYHSLARLGAEELKFVVDAAAPFNELEWIQGAADLPLAQLPRAYSMIRYRNDRLTGNQLVWPGATYTLPEIIATGGICPDQAYFATQAGKARGVPTLLFGGAGADGRHAWFGFLDGSRKWQLDAGRYAEQRFITGYARDPQTWAQFSDHDLQFLSEGFRSLPSFRQSRTHARFAAEYLALGNARAAGVAARKAVSYERRNQDGWELLIAAARKEGRDAKAVESLLREAALAFQRHPDLEAQYVTRVADSLRARGETTAAAEEVRRIATKHKPGRSDLSVQQARENVRRAMATQPLAEQIRVYNSAVDSYGRGEGIGFFDQVVAGFARHLVQLNQKAEALRALQRAHQALRVEPNSQLAGEFEALLKEIKAAKP
ncbi:tetratricopeptide repeat protein [Horticoccus sp. 23ND18S-11]|uniref:hypothetical protein n=1 Tax=Horticoccus sp. 23ND18S-11 TaxID=3391832 RepID=UPI0039C9FAA2